MPIEPPASDEVGLTAVGPPQMLKQMLGVMPVNAVTARSVPLLVPVVHCATWASSTLPPNRM